jgi:hypothetical protein
MKVKHTLIRLPLRAPPWPAASGPVLQRLLPDGENLPTSTDEIHIFSPIANAEISTWSKVCGDNGRR